MKKQYVFASLLLSLLLISCSGGDHTGKETTAAEQTETTPVTEAQYKQALPDGLDFNGYTINTLTGYCDTFNIDAEAAADVVNDVIYRRNLDVQDYLNVTLTNVSYDGEPWNEVTSTLRNSVMAGADDWQIVAGHTWFTQLLMYGGYMHNLYDAPYIDITKEWWATDYINGMSWEDTRYWLCGQLDTSYLGAVNCFFANKKLWSNYYDEDIYDMVFDGKWTMDALKQYTKEVYEDRDGSGDASEGDILGYVAESDITYDVFAYACDLKVTDYDENGNMYVAFTADPEPLVNFMEKWNQLINDSTVLTVRWNANTLTNTATIGNAIFTEGRLLFRYANLDACRSQWRDMEDDYAVLPMPKYDEAQENYLNVYRDWLILFGIPSTVSEDGLNATCAFLEACAAYSAEHLTPTYLDDALKNKYIRDEESVEVINMLLAQPICNFGAQIGDLGFSAFLKSIAGSDNIASRIAANKKKFDKTLEQILSGEAIKTTY